MRPTRILSLASSTASSAYRLRQRATGSYSASIGGQEGGGNYNVHIPLTCEELGQMAGTTLFTVSRLLTKWAEMGLLHQQNRGIVIEDSVGLVAIADECPVPVNELPVA